MLIGTDMPLQRKFVVACRSLLIVYPIIGTPSKAASQAERTLATLESYRTPLINPLFESQSYPGDRRPHKVHVPLPSKFGFDHSLERKKKRPSFVGPYSAEMSGMRKLLQKRKQELEEEETAAEKGSHKKKSVEVDIQREDKVEKRHQDETSREAGKEDVNGSPRTVGQVTPKATVLARSSKTDSYMGLRASNSRVTRSHAPAPQLKKHRNKFSLNEDDDDDDDVPMSVEDLKNYKAKVRILLFPYLAS
jgi:hypothetical protein